jgi:sulfur relay (sulfurtransferase) DsrF/TusC family protein
MLERGLGLGYDGVIMAFYKDYSEHLEHVKVLHRYPFLDLYGVESFLISLEDKVHYRPLTLSALAGSQLETRRKE